MTFDELTDRNAAEAARGVVLRATVAADEKPEDPDEFYDHQLEGLAAYDVDGTHLGEVAGLVHGAQDLLRIRTVDGREALVPFVAALVPEVDLAGGRVVIADRPGLVQPFPEDDEELRGRALMRLDYLTIFPDYLAPLQLSLPGKAVESGLLEVHVHDLRSWTHDRHRTVDDTPYGGGAGMVMKPEPWGEAFAALDIDAGDTIVFTTPSGERFDQRLAEELSTRSRLVFACGRYEGIDQRVLDHAREIARGARRSASATTSSTGARSPRWRSPRPWSGCCRASWATRSRWSRSRTPTDRRPAGVPRLHQAAGLGGPRGPRRAALRRPRRDRPVAPRPGASSYGGAPARPARRRRRSTTARRSSARSRPTPPSC